MTNRWIPERSNVVGIFVYFVIVIPLRMAGWDFWPSALLGFGGQLLTVFFLPWWLFDFGLYAASDWLDTPLWGKR